MKSATGNAIRYDIVYYVQYNTIRYIYMRSKTDEMASLIKRMAQERKNEEKLKTKLSTLEETVWAI